MTTPTLVLELLIVHFTLVVLLSRIIITRNGWTWWFIPPWISTGWRLLQKLSIFVPGKTNSFKKNINNAPFRRIAIPMNTNTAITGSYIENQSWYQQFDLRQIWILRGFQPIVGRDAADNCHLYVTTMRARNFQDQIPTISIENFEDYYVLVFELTSMQDTTENCH